MHSLVLVDAELELVPRSIEGHPACTAHAHRRGRRARETLLDATVHHSAMISLPDGGRRGRPDIVHLFLLTALDSILAIEGGLRTAVHTRNGDIIRLAPDVRLPKNCNRFGSLVERLLLEGKVPPKGPSLMTATKGTVEELLGELSPDRTVLLSPAGRPVEPREYFSGLGGKDLAVLIGGFPSGDFLSPAAELSDDTVSISPLELKVWTVASEVVVNLREARRPPLPAGGPGRGPEQG